MEIGSHRNHICDEAKFGTLLISDKICGFQNVRKYRLQIVTFDGQQPISSMFLNKKIWKFHNFFLNICTKCSQNINKLYSFIYCQKNHENHFKKPLLKPISPLKKSIFFNFIFWKYIISKIFCQNFIKVRALFTEIYEFELSRLVFLETTFSKSFSKISQERLNRLLSNFNQLF